MNALAPWSADGCAIWAGEDAGAGLVVGRTNVTPEDRADQQPLRSADGRCVLVACCRLDNRHELAAALGMAGGPARTAPDSAYVLAAYEKWGRRCVEHLCGAFRIVVWDRPSRTLWAAVDHLGEYSLFYSRGPAQFVLASAIPVVLAAPGVPRRLDVPSWTRHLVDARRLGETCLEGVFRLCGGQTLTVTAGSEPALATYWELAQPRSRQRFGSAAEIDEAFTEVFDAAVAARLRSTGPVGAFCSGGLDSSSVSALAASRLSASNVRLTTFTSVPSPAWRHPPRPGWENTDEPYVRSLAGMHRNLEPVFVPPDGRTFLDHLPAMHATTGSPFRNALNLPWLHAISESAAERGIRVLLTGEAGNATVSWSGASLVSEAIRRGRLRTAWREQRARRAVATRPQPSFARLVTGAIVPRRIDLLRAQRRLGTEPPWRTRAALSPAYAAGALPALELLDSYVSHRRGWAARSALMAQHHLGNGLRDAAVARTGVSHRDPTADVRVVEFCLGLPTGAFAGNGRQRMLIRRSMRNVLPPDIRLRTTRGAQAPDAHLQLAARSRELRGAVERLRQHAVTSELLDIPRMSRLVTEELDIYREASFGEVTAVTRTIAAGLFALWVDDAG